MLLGGFEPTILVSEGPQTYALDHAAAGIGPFAVANIKPQLFNCLTKVNTTKFNAQFSLFINNMFVTLLSSTCFEH